MPMQIHYLKLNIWMVLIEQLLNKVLITYLLSRLGTLYYYCLTSVSLVGIGRRNYLKRVIFLGSTDYISQYNRKLITVIKFCCYFDSTFGFK